MRRILILSLLVCAALGAIAAPGRCQDEVPPAPVVTGILPDGAGGVKFTASISLDNPGTFTAGDTTPSVSGNANFVTANTGATTISRLDDLLAGELVLILVGDANTTFDFTSSNLFGNGGQDYAATQNDLLEFYSPDGTNAYCSFLGKAAGGSGETNTASNAGADGVGVFYQKSGVNLEFRHIAPASNKITVTLNGQDIDLDIVESNFSGVPQSAVTNLTSDLAAKQDASTAATDAELSTHASSTDHDGRYYTESEIDAALALKVDITVADDAVALQSGTTAGDKAHIAAYENDQTTYRNIITWVSGNTPYGYLSGETNGMRFDNAGNFELLGTGNINNVTGTIFSYLTTLSGNVQTQINTKQDASTAATDAELSTHASSTDHDGRYYTESEIDAALALKVGTSGDQSIGGIKTFTTFPVTPSSAPTTDYQVANKKYVDDNSGGMSNPMTTQYDIIYGGSGGTPTRLGATNNALVGWNNSGVIGAYTQWSFSDASSGYHFHDDADSTKQLRVDVGSLTTGNKRVIYGIDADMRVPASTAINSSGLLLAAGATTVMKTDGWSISLGNDSDAISTGKKILKTVCPAFKHDLDEIELCTDEVSGSVTIDIWIDEKGSTSGLSDITDADSLFDTASEPAISDASSDNCVQVTSFDSGEDIDIPADSCYVINVDSAATMTYANVSFRVTRKD